jgi:undecaprenyl phosphate N,N'-diacetylbacillosamine 1-phosphate transferase
VKIYKKFGKRIIDLCLATLILVFMFPLLLIIVFFQVIIYEGEVFFLQSRHTLREKEFKMIKFITMTSEKDEHGSLLPDSQRLTFFGRILRRSSFDEIPNLFNVLTGDMSFVGPRPLPIKFLELMTEQHKLRYQVKSGITGLAQISGRNDLSWKQKFDLDITYVKNQSFLSDFKIIIKTFLIFFKKSINDDLSSTGIDNYKPNFYR